MISQDALDDLIRLNLHEESPLADLIVEACQIFVPGREPSAMVSVEASVLAAIAEGARAGRIAFYRYVDGGTVPATFEDALADRNNVFLVAERDSNAVRCGP